MLCEHSQWARMCFTFSLHATFANVCALCERGQKGVFLWSKLEVRSSQSDFLFWVSEPSWSTSWICACVLRVVQYNSQGQPRGVGPWGQDHPYVWPCKKGPLFPVLLKPHVFSMLSDEPALLMKFERVFLFSGRFVVTPYCSGTLGEIFSAKTRASLCQIGNLWGATQVGLCFLGPGGITAELRSGWGQGQLIREKTRKALGLFDCPEASVARMLLRRSQIPQLRVRSQDPLLSTLSVEMGVAWETALASSEKLRLFFVLKIQWRN